MTNGDLSSNALGAMDTLAAQHADSLRERGHEVHLNNAETGWFAISPRKWNALIARARESQGDSPTLIVYRTQTQDFLDHHVIPYEAVVPLLTEATAPIRQDGKRRWELMLKDGRLRVTHGNHIDVEKYHRLPLPGVDPKATSHVSIVQFERHGHNGTRDTDAEGNLPAVLGGVYRRAPEETLTTARDPFEVDPDIVDRGNRAHAAIQNALAETLRSLGIEPRSPSPWEPEYDLAWEVEGTNFVAEVKSTTKANEERQLRLGLGQVLRYRHTLGSRGRNVVAVLAIEREPEDGSWHTLCQQLGVRLVWRAYFGESPLRSLLLRTDIP